MSGPLCGTLTFLFTDLEGSTELLQQLGDVRFMAISAAHDRFLREAFLEAGAEEVSSRGDGFLVVFRRAQDAVAAAVAAQRALAAHPWPSEAVPRVRMGLHTGEPTFGTADYVGLDVNRAARVCATGYGGQILLSRATALLVEDKLPGGASLRDLGRHRLKDLRAPEQIFQVVHPDLSVEFPPLRSLDHTPHNLPLQLSSFVGREREIVEVQRMLMERRMLTLTGTGGSGKTRLALQIAAEVLEQYRDGIWLIEFAALSDSTLVPQTVAKALQVRVLPDRLPTATLLDHLRDRRCLLVFDNCEHLAIACGSLAEDLLQACPSLKILATSRHLLGVRGEVAWHVPPLSVPDRRSSPSPEEIARYEAVRLFVDRAAAARPKFSLTAQNAGAVAEVCQRLDGIPLAIELAAARIPVLSPGQIASRLQDRFRLLKDPSQIRAPRQRTLMAAMDWSHDLLSDAERLVLRRLAAFAGGWTLEAAEAVCGDGVDVLDVLAHLVLKSLVLVEEPERSLRYAFLETVRQYAWTRLEETGEVAAVRARHLDWYLRLAQEAESALLGPEQATWVDRLEKEHDNLRTALDWALQSESVDAGLHLAAAISNFWFIRGYLAEGRQWFDALLRNNGPVAPGTRANALLVAGRLAGYGQGDYTTGRAMCQQSLAIWRTLGDERGIATALGNLGIVAFAQADISTARACHQESLEIWRGFGDRWNIASSLHNLGRVAYHERSWDASRQLFEESMAIWKEIGDAQSSALARTNLGFVALSRGDLGSAARDFTASLAAHQEIGDRRRIAYALEGFACLAVATGQAARGARLFGAVESFRESVGSRIFPLPDRDRVVAEARTTLGKDAFAAAWSAGRTMTLVQAIKEADATTACVLRSAASATANANANIERGEKLQRPAG